MRPDSLKPSIGGRAPSRSPKFARFARFAGRQLPLAAWCAAACLCAARGDWPQFRGPEGQGIAESTRLPTRWSDTENVAWKLEIPGKGWSSAAVRDGRAYLTTSDEGSLRALCVDSVKGTLRWNVEVFAPPTGKRVAIHGKNTDASPTPIVEGDRIYVHFGHLGTACLDLSGKTVWANRSIDYPPVHGNGGSPILAGELLVFSCDGAKDPFVVALDRRTGVERWRTPRSVAPARRFSFSTPLLIRAGGRAQIVSPGSGAVCAYAPEDGRELWRARYGEGYSVVPRPVFGLGMVFLGSGFDKPSVLAVRVDGSGDVTDTHVAWQVSRSAPNTPSMILLGEELYFVSDAGIASCVSARDGTVHWSERLGGGFSASPIAAGGRLYFQNEEGVGYVVKSGRSFELLARNEVKERTLASPAVDGDALLLRGETHLFRIESR